MERKTIDTVLSELRGGDPAAYRRAEYLNGLRKALKVVRGTLSQSDVAQRAGRGQSEISRLESALTNYTRIGTVLDYVEACKGTLVINVRDKDGRIVSELDTQKLLDPLSEQHACGRLDRVEALKAKHADLLDALLEKEEPRSSFQPPHTPRTSAPKPRPSLQVGAHHATEDE